VRLGGRGSFYCWGPNLSSYKGSKKYGSKKGARESSEGDKAYYLSVLSRKETSLHRGGKNWKLCPKTGPLKNLETARSEKTQGVLCRTHGIHSRCTGEANEAEGKELSHYRVPRSGPYSKENRRGEHLSGTGKRHLQNKANSRKRGNLAGRR